MQLTRFTDLGLRTMMLLAANQSEQRRMTTGSIALSVNASEHHVAKAVTRLVEFGWVSARRGRTGGLFLTDGGRTMRVGQAIRLLEGDREVIDCDGTRPCPLLPACRLRHALAAAKEAFYRELDQYSLDDLAAPALIRLTAAPSRPD
jgi:Rrf2 family nitric oxide-sensitive transcriptional repressor